MAYNTQIAATAIPYPLENQTKYIRLTGLSITAIHKQNKMIIDGYDYEQQITHVIPLNDLQEHSETISEHIMGFYPHCDCECRPKSMLNPDNMGWIIIHSAFDGREAVEEFYEILKPKK